MPMFELILVLLLAAVLLTVLAERIAVPYPPCLPVRAQDSRFCHSARTSQSTQTSH
jgi:hypothetical protein